MWIVFNPEGCQRLKNHIICRHGATAMPSGLYKVSKVNTISHRVFINESHCKQIRERIASQSGKTDECKGFSIFKHPNGTRTTQHVYKNIFNRQGVS